MKKRLLCLLMVVVTLLSSNVVYASNVTSETTKVEYDLSDMTEDMLFGIPVYITNIYDVGNTSDVINESAVSSINADVDAKSTSSNGSDVVICDNSDFKVTRVSNSVKGEMLGDSLLATSLDRVKELIKGGTTVRYVNYYLPEALYNTAGGSVHRSAGFNQDSASDYEANTFYLGSYNGYRFQYIEYSISVETNYVEPGNLNGSINWQGIFGMGLELLADHYIRDEFIGSLRAVGTFFSNLTGNFIPAYDITYSESDGHIWSRISGDLYQRTVFIRDDLDRIQGNAYYAWGSTERFLARVLTDVKYPISQNQSGTYLYNTLLGVSPTETSCTSGYFGNSGLYQNIIDLYNNTWGYFTHDERIDIQNIITNLLY